MKTENLKPYYRKKVRVFFVDKTKMEGFFESFNSELDNEPDPPSIDLRVDKETLYELYLEDIDRIEIIK